MRWRGLELFPPGGIPALSVTSNTIEGLPIFLYNITLIGLNIGLVPRGLETGGSPPPYMEELGGYKHNQLLLIPY